MKEFTEEMRQIEDEVIAGNNRDFNFEKLEEELVELLEKLIKKRAKKSDAHKPKNEEIQQEMADVFIRLNILKRAEDWNDEVMILMQSKFRKLRGYIESGKHVGTV